MREILIEELNKISTKQKEIKENLLKENFDDLHSVSRANKLTLSWLELEVKKRYFKRSIVKMRIFDIKINFLYNFYIKTTKNIKGK